MEAEFAASGITDGKPRAFLPQALRQPVEPRGQASEAFDCRGGQLRSATSK
jgi:hypothetical protein